MTRKTERELRKEIDGLKEDRDWDTGEPEPRNAATDPDAMVEAMRAANDPDYEIPESKGPVVWPVPPEMKDAWREIQAEEAREGDA